METNIKICPKCGSPLIIDEWRGWYWMCIHCEYSGGPATQKEIDYEQKWYIEAEKEARKNEVWTKEEIDEAKKEAEKIQEDLNWK